MDQHHLERQVAAVIRRSRFWVAVQGTAIWLALTGIFVWGVGLLDYCVRLQDRGVRVLLSLLLISFAGWAAQRFLRPLWASVYDEVAVAQRIERGFPQIQGLLASALEFLKQETEEPGVGSPQLRRAVVARTGVLAEQLDFTRILDLRAPRRALALAGVVVALLAVSAVARPSAAGLAAQRLVFPWRELAWPRRHHLRLDAPPGKSAAGQDVELTIVDDTGRLPELVTVQWRYADEATDQTSSREILATNGKMTHRLERLSRNVRIRAFGGDDDTMSWHEIVVVEPPRVESLEARILPPAYTGETPQPVGQPLRALVDSRVELRGTATRAVRQAAVRRIDAPSADRVALRVADNGLDLSLTAEAPTHWVVKESGTFVLEVTDHDDLTAEVARWVIEAVADHPPALSLISPAPQAYATPQARLEVRGTAKDDIGIRRVTLFYRPADERTAEPSQLSLFSTTRADGGANPKTAAATAAAPQRVEIKSSWDLSQEAGLRPGMALEYWVVARDGKEQVAETEVRRLEIVSREEIEQRLARREAALLDQMREALRVQRGAQEQTRAIADATAAQTPGAREADQLQGVELAQRNVRRLLGDEQAGVTTLLGQLIEELIQNQAQEGQTAERLRGIQSALVPLIAAELPVVERDLLHAVRAIREAMPGFDEPLREAVARQERIVAALERIVEDLAPWDQLHRQALELAEVRRGLEEVRGETETLLAEQAAARAAESQAALGAVRRRLAERQFEMSRRVDRVLARMSGSRAGGDADSTLTRTVDATLEIAERTALNGQLREAGQATQDNRLGTASERQQQSLAALDQMLDALAQRTSSDDASTAEGAAPDPRKLLDAWEAAIVDLIPRQVGVIELLPPPREAPPRKEQRGETTRAIAARQLEVARQGADQLVTLPDVPTFRFVLRGAVGRMREAAERLDRGQTAEATASAREALRRLEQLRKAVSESSPDASTKTTPPGDSKPESGQEPEASMRGQGAIAELKLLRGVQEDLRERTAALETQRGSDGSLAPDRQRELQTLAREQGELVSLLEGLLE